MDNLSRTLLIASGFVASLLCFLVIQGEPFSVKLGLTKDTVKSAEFYPFSSFSMYSKFSSKPIYLYLTTADDELIACHTRLGVLSSEIKKIYDKELRVVGKREKTAISKLSQELKSEAGIITLDAIRAKVGEERISGEGIGEIKLYEVVIRRGENGAITKTTTLVGQR